MSSLSRISGIKRTPEQSGKVSWPLFFRALLAPLFRNDENNRVDEVSIESADKYLSHTFFLSASDLSPDAIESALRSNGISEMQQVLRHAILVDRSLHSLLLKGIINQLIEWNFDEGEAEILASEQLKRVRVAMKEDEEINLARVIHRKKSRIKVALSKPHKINMIDPKREKALDEMQRDFPFLFEEQIMGLSAAEMREHFIQEDLGADANEVLFLPTYFNSASFGIQHRGMIEAVVKLATSPEHLANRLNGTRFPGMSKHEAFITACKLGTLQCLEPSKGRQTPHQFTPENVFCDENGMKAFVRFVKAYIKKNDRILITPEIYYGMEEKLIEGVGEGNLVFLPKLSDDSQRDQAMITQLLRDEKITTMVVEEMTRRGTVFPLRAFAEARDSLRQEGQRICLVIDGCQAFGRKQTDLRVSRPDAYFASCKKGSDLGGLIATLMLSSDFIADPHFGKKITHDGGTDKKHKMTQYYFAAKPEVAQKYNANLQSDHVLSVQEREYKLQELSAQFVRLVDAIDNEREIIHLPYPAHSYRDSDKEPIAEQLTGIFVCEIEGITASQVSDIAKGYGVTIDTGFEGSSSDSTSTFRIAFHPHMGTESVALLGHVLRQAIEMSRKG